MLHVFPNWSLCVMCTTLIAIQDMIQNCKIWLHSTLGETKMYVEILNSYIAEQLFTDFGGKKQLSSFL